MSQTPETDLPVERPLTAQRLAQYVARGRCERHLRYAMFPAEAQALLTRYGLEIEPLSPLLSGAGRDFEREMVEALAERAPVTDLRGAAPEDFVARLRAQGEGRALYYQPSLRGRLGAWECAGQADLVEVVREGGRTRAVVVDFKASARETVSFRLQVAFYVRLLEATLAEAGAAGSEVRGAVAARDTVLSDEWQTFDLALYLDEIERLVSAADSDVARAARAGEGGARYHLRPTCDGCPYNALCFAETAEREDLSLVPLISFAEKRALEAAGVADARALAGLMRYGARAMEPVEGREELLRRAAARWPLAARLPVLAQRARAALRRLDRRTEARSYVLGSDFGSLPDPARHPGLVRVFIDAQRDYLKDKLYLVAARVVGPSAAREVVEMTAAPPDAESERALLVAWVQRLLPAVAEVAGATAAPLHVYTYAARGERALLDALARHFDALCAIPAFYDLLNSRAALSQPMVSLLAEEVRARLNLAPVCHNLYEVAAALGFRWQDGEIDFRRRFRARVFDNRRTFMRDGVTGAFSAPARDAAPPETDTDAPPPFVRVESAARFGAEVPLEYAYAAWGELPSGASAAERERAQLRGFLGVTAAELRAFAAARTRAMQHIEESFTHKNRHVEKEPLDLTRLGEVEVEPGEVPLSRALEDFLLLEHHASLQEKLLHLAQAPAARAETGRTSVLRCESYERDEERVERARLRFADAEGRDSSAKELAGVRLRPGDWVVLTGGMTDAVPIAPGARIAAHFTHLGTVTVAGG